MVMFLKSGLTEPTEETVGTEERKTHARSTAKTYYDYPRAYKMIDELQTTGCVIFSDGGPGCRWVGNENGFAGATNWSFPSGRRGISGYPKYRELQYGHADGNQWVAAECDVSIRPDGSITQRKTTR